MNREQRLRKAIPGADDSLIGALAQLPADDVGRIVAALRQARKDERHRQAELKRQRKADNRNHGNYDEEQLAQRNLAVVGKQADRAEAGSIEALEALGELRRYMDEWITLAVTGCRDHGYSDHAIAQTLNVTRQAVSQRYPRQDILPNTDPVASAHS